MSFQRGFGLIKCFPASAGALHPPEIHSPKRTALRRRGVCGVAPPPETHLPEVLIPKERRAKGEKPLSSVYLRKTPAPGHPAPLPDLPGGRAPGTQRLGVPKNAPPGRAVRKARLVCSRRTIEELTEMTAIHRALCLHQWKGQTN